MYNDVIFNAGRKKIIEHFLKMPDIFKTKYFHQKNEKQARKNLSEELVELEKLVIPAKV